MRWLLTAILVLGLALFGMACQGEEEKSEATITPAATATGAATAAASPTTTAGTPQTPELTSGWTKIAPGGETICSRGTPFAYFVHPGTVNRLVVYFQGGGACWNDTTCSLGGIFKETAD
ncbi:MAG: pectinacetylesterase family protein, partial [Dehalococcoidia bacterium]|nr:pectinacetylesterase family protein [Dehalococcoidia bacterium]